MKSHTIQSRSAANRRIGVVSRFLIINASVGFLIGLIEASLLWTTPRVIPLLHPDVGWVIWFLAPLEDMAIFSFLGLGLGWIAARMKLKEVVVAVGGGFVIAFAVIMFLWFHVETGLLPFQVTMIGYPLSFLALGTGISLLIVQKWRNLLAGLAGVLVDFLMKPTICWGFAVLAFVMIVGIGVSVERPTFSDAPAQAATPPGLPNIIFITLDTVRADHVSAYGYTRPTTPSLDRFARTGALFENAIAATSWTLASHSSMFTGLLPQQHGADWAVPLASNPWSLAEILRSQGYATAGFVANELYLQKGWGIAQGFDHYEDDSDSLRHNVAATQFGSVIAQPIYQSLYRFDYFDRENAGEVNQRFFRWFDHRRQRPFFVFINYFDAHEPYVAPKKYSYRFGVVPPSVMRKLHLVVRDSASPDSLNTQERSLLIDGYDNCLAYLDAHIGELLQFLRQSPEWQNTYVIITSDHGEEFGRHGSYEHGRNLYRSVLHVPLIISGPGVPQGLRVNHPVATRQLFSTVLDLAGGGKTLFSDHSLARYWTSGFSPKPFDQFVVSELVPVGDLGGQHAMASLTTSQWQYIEHQDGRQELYRWTTDPEEDHDLATSPQEQTALQDFRSHLFSLVSDATGPWLGSDYLRGLGKTADASRISLLFPQPLRPGASDNPYRIGIAQSYFKSQEPTTSRPSQSERDLLKSLPYQ